MRDLARKIQDEHQAFMDALIERSLLIDANPLEVHEYQAYDSRGRPTSEMSLVWGGASGLSYLFSEHSSIEQYLEAIRRRDYNFCLADGSIIQIHYRLERDGVKYHRLCFQPCPYPYPFDGQEDLGLADIPDLMSPGELIRDVRLASPIRFDFDRHFSDEKHAHSHLTINRASCRVPAFGPVSLGHFMRFIFRYFFEAEFDEPGWWPEVNPKVFAKTLTYPAPHEFHLESSVGFD
jgi:hypothetical protein